MMNMTIHQTINIHLLKIGSITNSSVLQIGSTGNIQAQADLYNTGGFTEPAALAVADEGVVADEALATPLVPLAPQ